MKKNRRNYYRILYVQAEAPLEVIKASYRTLMGPLRHHPDLGGAHEVAALLNEAYAVLSDPDKRRAYDRTLGKERLRGRVGGHGALGTPSANTHAPSAAQAPDPTCWRVDRCCPFCRHPLPATLHADARCARCEASLKPPLHPEGQGRELFGRRASSRMAKNHPVVLVPGWKANSISALMRDLSLTGVRVLAQAPITVNQAIRIIDPDFDAVAVVVSSRRNANLFSIHARFLTLRLTRQTGVFFSAKA
jgi:curved DNA-binding protein CbpA